MAPELRTDPLWGHSVILAPERLRRPRALMTASVLPDDPATCPFCRGREQETPDAIAEYPGPASGLWQVRVIPNKYPAVSQGFEPVLHSQPYATGDGVTVSYGGEDSLRGCGTPAEISGVGGAEAGRPSRGSVMATLPTPALGRHEVVIECPDHRTRWLELCSNEQQLALHAAWERLRAWRTDPRLRFAILFKNEGRDAGASVAHLHSQVLGLETVPAGTQRAWARQRDYFEETRRCLLCDIVASELALGNRMVLMDDQFVALCPFAARVPYEVWIVPRQHASHFELMEPGLIAVMADRLTEILARLSYSIPDLAFNFTLHSAPFDIPLSDHYHWHMRIFPRITQQAGFEWGTGSWINPLPPEQSARRLRDAQPGVIFPYEPSHAASRSNLPRSPQPPARREL